ncbi:hypothetical protein [Phenylobacterium sp.]|uniref:hypothetical protein n=1 Tax=Phenylobacterium sp. TaxID=1871053 RepID=UPI002CA179DE|nr:hypothetical protein [Phenylobacterium sp.]HVI31649.1 hypothetical protein [Phenylobacterium sp.]
MSAILGAALWKGGPDERFAAVAFLAAWAATVVFRDDQRNNPQWGILFADIGLFVALVVLVLRTDRFWPIWMAGFELLSVITHAGRIVDRNVGAWAYITAGQIWGYLTLFALAWGTWAAWRERQLIDKADPARAAGATRR